MAMTSSKLLFSQEKDKKTDLDEVKIQGGGHGYMRLWYENICCSNDGSIEVFVINSLKLNNTQFLHGMVIKALPN